MEITARKLSFSIPTCCAYN